MTVVGRRSFIYARRCWALGGVCGCLGADGKGRRAMGAGGWTWGRSGGARCWAGKSFCGATCVLQWVCLVGKKEEKKSRYGWPSVLLWYYGEQGAGQAQYVNTHADQRGFRRGAMVARGPICRLGMVWWPVRSQNAPQAQDCLGRGASHAHSLTHSLISLSPSPSHCVDRSQVGKETSGPCAEMIWDQTWGRTHGGPAWFVHPSPPVPGPRPTTDSASGSSAWELQSHHMQGCRDGA